MLTHDIKLLTFDDNLPLKSSDYQGFKYETKKKSDQTLFDVGKRSYCERRGGHWRSPCPRQLKRLESQLKDRSVVLTEFTNDSLISIVFSSGAIAYLTIKLNSLDVTQVLFDRYCVGKLSGQAVTAVAITKSHLLFVHVDKIATLVTFGKTNVTLPCRISDREPHIQSFELGGSSRRTDRRLSYYEYNNKTNVLVWSATTTEPAPWSPVLEDLANLHLYKITNQQTTLLAFHQLENDTLLAELAQKPDTVHIVEQVLCHKSGVSIEWVRFDVSLLERASKLRSCSSASTRLSLPAPARLVRRHRARLLLAAIDGSLHIAHKDVGLTHSAKTGFIVSDIRWSGDLIMATEENGKLQCFDKALSLLHYHTKFIELNNCLNSREQNKIQTLSTRAIKNGVVKLVMFDSGPLALLRISHPRLLTAWQRLGRSANSVSLLRALDWDENGPECLLVMTQIVNKAMAGGQAAEGAAEAAIGAYMAPLAPHSHAAKKYTQPVYRLARKFFHHLLRRGRLEKALSLAVDLEAWDLFVDARWAASRYKMQNLVDEASTLATYYAQFEQQDSDCSCSECSSHSCSASDNETSTSSEPAKTKPPPLPRLTHTPHTPAPPLHTLTQLSHTLTLPPRTLKQPPNTLSHTLLNTPHTQHTITQPPHTYEHTNSIRPNLHQYLDRDQTIWNTDLKNDTVNERTKSNLKWTDNILNTQLKTISEIPGRTQVNESNQKQGTTNYINVFQYKNDITNTIYRYSGSNYLTSTNLNNRTHDVERKPPEKNKVKFSDTVTVAVVAKEPSAVPAVERELADSLPLSPPHKYLAAFEPLPQSSYASSSLALSSPHGLPPPPAQGSPHERGGVRGPSSPHAPPPGQYQKPPKIKVVHFGLV